MEKTITIAVVEPSGDFSIKEIPNTYEGLTAELNDGYLECVMLDGNGLHAYVDEEGKLKNLADNPVATKFVEMHRTGFSAFDYICGRMLVSESTGDGNERSLTNPGEIADQLRQCGGEGDGKF